MRKLFYGWFVVFASIIILAVGLGTYISTNSIFVKPVCDSLGFARGEFSLHRTITTLIAALLLPFYGRLIQRIGSKKVIFTSAFVLGLTAIGYSFATTLWHFYLLAFVSGVFLNGISFMSIGVLISAWFNGKKGLAIGLAYSGSGLGAAIMVPVISHIIEIANWRWAYRFMGFFGIILLLPTIVVFVKNNPAEIGLEPLPSDKMEQKDDLYATDNITFKEAVGTKKFWILIIAFFLINFFAGAANTHSAPYLSDLGYSAVFVSSVISLYMVFLTVGKIILGFIYDRLGILAGNLIISIFILGFPIAALLSDVPIVPWIYAVFIGMASCAVSILIPILIMRYYGKKDFPRIFSFCSMVSTFAPSVSVPAMGAIFDIMGSYRPAWVIFFFLSIIITVNLIGAEVLDRKEHKNKKI